MDVILEVIIILGTIIFGAIFTFKDSEESKKICTISLGIFILICVGFSVTQVLTVFHVLDVNIKYTPVQILSMIAIIYWFVFGLKKMPVFNGR